MSRSRHFSNRSALRCGRCEHNRLSFLFSFSHFRSFSTIAPLYRVPRYGGGNVSGILGLLFQLALLCGGESTGSRQTTAPIDTAALGADELRTLVGEVRSALHAHRDGPCAAHALLRARMVWRGDCRLLHASRQSQERARNEQRDQVSPPYGAIHRPRTSVNAVCGGRALLMLSADDRQAPKDASISAIALGR